jgi:hypothetical protein
VDVGTDPSKPIRFDRDAAGVPSSEQDVVVGPHLSRKTLDKGAPEALRSAGDQGNS